MNVISIEKPAATPLPDIRALDGRYHCLVRYKGHLVSAVLCRERLSPSRKFIEIGNYYSDQLRPGWYPIEELEMVEVIKRVEPTPPAKPGWWKRLLGAKQKA